MSHPESTHFKRPFGLFWLLAVGVIVWGALHYSRNQSAVDAERIEKCSANLELLNAADERKLNSYAWIDRSKGSVQIPIDRAMQVVASELAEQKPHPAYPVATPLPTP